MWGHVCALGNARKQRARSAALAPKRVRFAAGRKTACYKLHDNKIRAVIGQKSGQASKFDVMGDQAGYNHYYSGSNRE